MAAPVYTCTVAAAPPPAVVAPPPATPYGNLAEILPSLPLETRCPPFHLRRYNGFWLPEAMLAALPAIHAHFEPRPQDIFLASFPKSGTTWLKALAFATMNRALHSPFDAEHPLRRRNPHDCVRFLKALNADEAVTIRRYDELEDAQEGALSAPPAVLLNTHLPCSMLPERIRENRIVEEEEGGVVDAIVELCSLSELKGMEVNRNGSNYLAVKNEFYFRKGVVGDWSNHLTPEMSERLDKIVDAELQGSGLDLSPLAAVSDELAG